MTPLKKDPVTEIAKVQNLCATISLQIADLERRRHELLVTGSDEQLEKVDNEIARLRRAASIHRERIEALRVAQREQATADRERQAEAAITKIAAKLKQREASAAVLERAVGEVVKAYSTLVAGDRELRGCWQGLPAPSFWATDVGIAGEVLGQLHQGTRAAGAGLFPQAMWRALNDVLRMSAITATVAAQNSALLAAMRSVPLEPEVADNSPDVIDQGVAA